MDPEGMRNPQPPGFYEKEAKTEMLLDLIASVFRDNPELLFFSTQQIEAIAKIVESTGRTVFNGS